jgi:hypothetical protein
VRTSARPAARWTAWSFCVLTTARVRVPWWRGSKVRVAALGQQQARALERFETARRLDPDDTGEALLAKAQLLFDARRLTPSSKRCWGRRRWTRARSLRVCATNLRAIEAMLRFRNGDVRGGRELLQSELAAADRSHSIQAAPQASSSTSRRRAARGNVEHALAHVGRAIELYERGGNLAVRGAGARAARGRATGNGSVCVNPSRSSPKHWPFDRASAQPGSRHRAGNARSPALPIEGARALRPRSSSVLRASCGPRSQS